MKNYFFVFIIIVISFFVCNDKSTKNTYTLSKIEILYIEFNTETVARVDCHTFLNAFPDAKKIIITDNKILKNFEKEFKKLKLANDDLPIPDTRIVINIYTKEGQIEEFCIGRFTLTNGSELFVFSNSFMKLLKKIKVIDAIE